MSFSEANPNLSSRPLADADPAVAEIIRNERRRQSDCIELIASENFASLAVMETQGSVLTNKYAEGYPGRRYYGGCVNADAAERLAIERAKLLFRCEYANVQPHSGSQANEAVFLSLLSPGDAILGLDLKAGGHLTHGAPMNMSGKWFDAVGYNLHPETHLIDMDDVERLALKHKPKLIITGGSAYSRMPDFAAFRAIADRVGAILIVDMAHFAGLVAGDAVASPFPYADIVTSTTHKTLRGPRGGLILTNSPDLAKKINSAIFPGLQGGPLVHVIAAKAVAFGEALNPSFKIYARNVIDNCRTLAATLISGGIPVVSGGTDTHLAVADLRPYGVTGAAAEGMLERAGITLNKNSVPGDIAKALVTSGIRIGSAAGTTRGFGTVEFNVIGGLILDGLDALRKNADTEPVEAAIRDQVADLTARFPLPY